MFRKMRKKREHFRSSLGGYLLFIPLFLGTFWARGLVWHPKTLIRGWPGRKKSQKGGF